MCYNDTIDKHLNTAINFRKSRKITYTKRRQIIGWKEIPYKYNDRNFIFDYMQSRSDLHHKQIFLTLLILFSGITRQPLLFKVAYENTGRCINSFYEHKDFIIVQLHLYFCIYWYLLILKINLLPYYHVNFLCSYDSIKLLTKYPLLEIQETCIYFVHTNTMHTW